MRVSRAVNVTDAAYPTAAAHGTRVRATIASFQTVIGADAIDAGPTPRRLVAATVHV